MDFLGLLYLVLLFICCFFAVHFVKLAVIGLKSIRKKPEPKPEPKEKKEPKPKEPQPVYYIVEKKRSRSKATYSQPKEIQFKDKV
ncbi:MAG: hypothetical protein LUD27_07575 [Clostridia bacterium]|nr:hypothetical protein [Clostridia bacterium]